MVSGWHVTHLPVRVTGRQSGVVDQVVVDWDTLVVRGFLLTPRPFRFPWVRAGGYVTVTPTGLEIGSNACVEMISRRHRRSAMGQAQRYRKCPVIDSYGRVIGRLADYFFDEKSFRITHLVISHGILADFLSGAMVLPIENLAALSDEAIKILEPGNPLVR